MKTTKVVFEWDICIREGGEEGADGIRRQIIIVAFKSICKYLNREFRIRAENEQ